LWVFCGCEQNKSPQPLVAESLKAQCFQRLENWGAFRAFFKPYFFLSFVSAFYSLSYSTKSIEKSRDFLLSLSYRFIVFQIFVGVLWVSWDRISPKPAKAGPGAGGCLSLTIE